MHCYWLTNPAWLGEPSQLAALRRCRAPRKCLGEPSPAALLARGAPVDAAKLDGSTALHLCAARGLHAMARGLLDHGADPSRRTVSGSSPLDRARLFRDDRLARVLELAAATPPASPTN